MDVNEQWKEEIKPPSYQYVTISYNTTTVREIWHPKDFDLEQALERHTQTLISKQPDSMAK